MFYTLSDIIIIFFKSVEVLIVLRILMSWMPFSRGSDFVNFVRDFTDPVLKPFRVVLHMSPSAGIDLSPIIALFVLSQIEILALNLIRL